MKLGAVFGAFLPLLSIAPARAQSVTEASLATPAPKDWLRMYPLVPYSAYWHVKLRVKDMDRAVAKFTALLAKRGGKPIVPLDNSVSSRSNAYQQASYEISPDSEPKILAGLKRLGAVEQSDRTQENYPGLFEEVHAKLVKLRGESQANAAALSKMPAIAGLVAELTDHLSLVERVREEGRRRVRLDVELQAPAPPPARP